MIRAILMIGLLFLAIPAEAEPLALARHYQADGKNPDGSSYSGSVDVTIISDTTFTIVWKIDGSVYKGFGMRRNDSIAATYTLDGEPGLVIYELGKGGTFSGVWAVRGQNGNGTEVLTPTK